MGIPVAAVPGVARQQDAMAHELELEQLRNIGAFERHLVHEAEMRNRDEAESFLTPYRQYTRYIREFFEPVGAITRELGASIALLASDVRHARPVADIGLFAHDVRNFVRRDRQQVALISAAVLATSVFAAVYLHKSE